MWLDPNNYGWYLCTFGLVIAVVVVPSVKMSFPLFRGYANLASGSSEALTGFASGLCIGIVGDAAVRALADQSRLIMEAMLIFIFIEVLCLYYFIHSFFVCDL